MSEDIKAKLKEKMGAAVSEEDLEKVAGGTSEENKELITALYKIDPQGVNALMSSLKPGNEHNQIAEGLDDLLQKNLGTVIHPVVVSSTKTNVYAESHHGYWTQKSHAEILAMIDAEAKERGLN